MPGLLQAYQGAVPSFEIDSSIRFFARHLGTQASRAALDTTGTG